MNETWNGKVIMLLWFFSFLSFVYIVCLLNGGHGRSLKGAMHYPHSTRFSFDSMFIV